jgi:hypothetical protein
VHEAGSIRVWEEPKQDGLLRVEQGLHDRLRAVNAVELTLGWGMAQTADEWAAGGQEEMAEKYFKPKNANLSLCKACGLKVKADDFDMKDHITKKCEKL